MSRNPRFVEMSRCLRKFREKLNECLAKLQGYTYARICFPFMVECSSSAIAESWSCSCFWYRPAGDKRGSKEGAPSVRFSVLRFAQKNQFCDANPVRHAWRLGLHYTEKITFGLEARRQRFLWWRESVCA